MPTSPVPSLLRWYQRHGRRLPWRDRHDPYAIWVAEVMLQQTRVETVIPYYARWMARFPNMRKLAVAHIDEVLQQWEGLGYYRRAHHLHQAAQQVMMQRGGELPSSVKQLRALPGVGEYTAAAIAAQAFNTDVIALDGNLRRVLSRLTDLEIDPRSPQGRRRLLAQAEAMLPPGQASAFNQALMDLGATICLPRAPRCDRCPLHADCLAKQRGTQLERPVRPARRPQPRREAAAMVLYRGDKVLIGRRPEGKLLGGLWEFPGGKRERGETLEGCLRREIREELGVHIQVEKRLVSLDHAYTHYAIRLHAFRCRLIEGEPQAREHEAVVWAPISVLDDYPMGKLDRQIARLLQSES